METTIDFKKIAAEQREQVQSTTSFLERWVAKASKRRETDLDEEVMMSYTEFYWAKQFAKVLRRTGVVRLFELAKHKIVIRRADNLLTITTG